MRKQVPVQIRADHPGFDNRGVSFSVQPEDPVHVDRKIQYKTFAEILTGDTRSRPSRCYGDAFCRSNLYGIDHILLIPGMDDRGRKQITDRRRIRINASR